MISRLQTHRDNAAGIMAELLAALDGMDYCLDWKPEAAAWSSREVVYHLLDTPPGGIHFVISGVLSGRVTEYELWSDLTNLTPERAEGDMEQISADIHAFFGSIEEALNGAAENDLDEKSVMMHQRTREVDEARTVEEMLTGFGRHWRAHLDQVKELRESLGFD